MASLHNRTLSGSLPTDYIDMNNSKLFDLANGIGRSHDGDEKVSSKDDFNAGSDDEDFYETIDENDIDEGNTDMQ